MAESNPQHWWCLLYFDCVVDHDGRVNRNLTQEDELRTQRTEHAQSMSNSIYFLKMYDMVRLTGAICCFL